MSLFTKYWVGALLTLWGCRWPKFMNRPKGQNLQQRIWKETRGVLEAHVPEVATVNSIHGGAERSLEK